MSKHTPGPWHYIGVEPDYPNEHSVVALNRFGKAYIARTIGGLNEAEEQANARLITAAPALLEVLQDLAEIRDALMNDREPPMNTEQWEAKWFAAMAKATGGTVQHLPADDTEGGAA